MECAAILIVEPIQGEGGHVVPLASFLHTIREIADPHGGPAIADEVQSEWGVRGECLHLNILILCPTSLPRQASGLPLGALVARSDLMKWGPGAHASTFGGNPVAIAASLVTLDLLEEKSDCKSPQRWEYYLLEGARELQKKHAIIGDVRGNAL